MSMRIAWMVTALGIAAVTAACSGVDGAPDAAAEAAPAAAAADTSTTDEPAAPDGADGAARMLSHAELVAITGISSLSEPQMQHGEGGRLVPVCGERAATSAPHRWWDYSIVPLEDRQPWAEFVGVAVFEFATADEAQAAFDAARTTYGDCDEFTYRRLAYGDGELIELDLADGAFVHLAVATETDEFLPGTQDRALDVPARACQMWVLDDEHVAAVGTFTAERRVSRDACLELVRAAAARLDH